MQMKPLSQAETRTISIAASPAAVLDVVADPRNLPRWAPAFARAVHPDGEDWLIDTAAGQARFHVHVSRKQGTVDLLVANDPRRGAFSRVIANGEGSEYLFTVFFDRDTEPAAIERQMAIVEDELRAVRSLSEP